MLDLSVLSRNPDFKFGGGQFVILPNFFFSTTREDIGNIVNLYGFFFAEQKKNNINGAAGEKFFGNGVKI